MKKARSPVVVVLGHVDHGKTTLLDTIRKTKVAAREAGGITQSVGASRIETKGGFITFIDTPGHAAFSQMRSRGARIADIALLVVASDDGVKPQTKEAISYIQKVGVPFIVTLTKTDLPSANTEKAKMSLLEAGVAVEGLGGSVPVVEVSAKRGDGLDDLLEMILLMAEVEGVEGDPDGDLEGYVFETNKDKRGTVVSIVLKNGKLKTGDTILADGIEAKVKGLFDEDSESVAEIGPGRACAVMGFSEFPSIGSRLNDKGETDRHSGGKNNESGVNQVVGDEEVAVILKASSSGTLEAVIGSMPEGVVVLRTGVGDVNETDVFFAKSIDADIYTFESKIPSSVSKLAEAEKVVVKDYKVIYELIDDLSQKVELKKTKILGIADILMKFPYEGMKVAGCKLREGKIEVKSELVLKRGDLELGVVRVVSMRRGKQLIESALVGEECGILFKPQLDFNEGDVLLSVQN